MNDFSWCYESLKQIKQPIAIKNIAIYFELQMNYYEIRHGIST